MRLLARTALPSYGRPAAELARPQLKMSSHVGARQFAADAIKGKSTPTQTPIMYYTATQQATSSINHRITYINWLAIIILYDAFTAVVDL